MRRRYMNRQDLLEYFEVYNTGDYEKTMKKYYTPDAVFESADYKLEGRDKIIQFMTESHKGSTEKMKAKHLLLQDNVAAAEIEAVIEVFEDKPDFHIKPLKKGDSITLRMAAIYEIRDNKICYVRLYRFTKWSSL
jgi:limonene-1,2-epoxide hydrolase